MKNGKCLNKAQTYCITSLYIFWQNFENITLVCRRLSQINVGKVAEYLLNQLKSLKSMQLEPKTYKCIFDDWDVKQEEWYHALISIEDLPIILAIPDLKIYAWCRCKVVARDNSEDHLHWHGLVHFPKIKLDSWRRQATRKEVKLSPRKNTLKKIHCLVHVIGVKMLEWEVTMIWSFH